MPTTHRRYTKRTKLTAVLAAEATSVLAAAESAGIPMTTLAYWYNSPEFVELRNKTREQRGEMYAALSVKVTGEIERRLPEFEPRDLSVLLGILTDKAQLLSGEPTERTENRDMTEIFDDHETRAIVDAAREYVGRAGSAEGPGLATETTVAPTGETGSSTA